MSTETDALCTRIMALASYAPDADYEAGSIAAEVRKVLDARDRRIAELEAAAAPLVVHWQRIKRLMNGRAPAELQVAGVDLERLDAALKEKTDAD